MFNAQPTGTVFSWRLPDGEGGVHEWTHTTPDGEGDVHVWTRSGFFFGCGNKVRLTLDEVRI